MILKTRSVDSGSGGEGEYAITSLNGVIGTRKSGTTNGRSHFFLC